MHVIVHGGAGPPPEDPADRQAVLDEAAACASEETTTLDAVCAAVRVLEVDPRFNAGIGSAVQSDGTVRTDAGLMTDNGTTGAAASMTGVCHAVEVARIVATETPHVMLAGDRAVDVAETVGVETGVDLWADRTRERWADEDPPGRIDDQFAWVRERFGNEDTGDLDGTEDRSATETSQTDDQTATETPRDYDTVGAVACDGESVAAATSTGGRWAALAGRVGDVPQIGAGFYASSTGGASATGAGEDIAREGLARRAVRLLEQGANAETAARVAIEEFDRVAEDVAGLIVMGTDGTAGQAYNSSAMQTARRI